MLRFVLLICMISCLISCTGKKADKINHIVVHKSKREMSLFADEKLVTKVPIALGFNPESHKQKEGDGRTPEGRYYISWRNPQSQYFLSLHISYPNPQDAQQAQKQGYSPGGQIMIHGLPKNPKWPQEEYLTKDWTNGCIAVSNPVMKELFEKIVLNSPIDIYP